MSAHHTWVALASGDMYCAQCETTRFAQFGGMPLLETCRGRPARTTDFGSAGVYMEAEIAGKRIAALRDLLTRAKSLIGSAYWKCNDHGACSGCASESERDCLVEEIDAAIKETTK